MINDGYQRSFGERVRKVIFDILSNNLRWILFERINIELLNDNYGSLFKDERTNLLK
jgi:hypothetical protein